MDDATRNRIKDLVNEHLTDTDPSGWFDKLYQSAQGDAGSIPWADLAPNPNLIAWLDRGLLKPRGRALTVGCGLGDDAEELSRRGWDVTAFDISPTAIDWCKRRFPNTRVTYAVADLLATPDDWPWRFDFVFESYTLQALPVSVRERAIASVATLVAPGGSLLVICRARDETDPDTGPPWPLLRRDMDQFIKAHGLTERTFEDYPDETDNPPARRFRVWYYRS